MAKKASDLILRDRLQFTIGTGGDLDVVYGRIDLSDYVNTVNKKGMAVKEVRFMVRDPNSGTQTGSFNAQLAVEGASTTNPANAFLKLFATTTAYENGADVGIASPNVFAVVEHQHHINVVQENNLNVGGNQLIEYFEFGTPDLHPDGYTVVTDILIGVCASGCTRYTSETLEVDIMLIAEPITVSQKELNEMLVQAQDL